MTCQEAQQLLHAYLDDELDMASGVQVQGHLSGCDRCREMLAAMRAVQSAVQQPTVRYNAPAALREQVSTALADVTGANDGRGRTHRRWTRPATLAALAATLFIASLAAYAAWFGILANHQADELVAGHLRSLEENHLIDVASTDQHTVKPWFAGKLDYSPQVINLTSDGFPLVGGRLDYIDHRKVAALVYHRNKHLINLFTWPGEASPREFTEQGFNLVRFQTHGMVCWAVSDVNLEELRQFTRLIQSR